MAIYFKAAIENEFLKPLKYTLQVLEIVSWRSKLKSMKQGIVIIIFSQLQHIE
jgi:hypothetical protein